MTTDLPAELAREQERIDKHAQEYGLTYFTTVFEIVDYQQMNALASYGGFPTRYPHWRFGMEYNQLSKSYEYGLHRIYEMVINNDPTYAYLLEGNTMLDQKLVMAHVLGHADFFKNNLFFEHTNRKMIDAMANHSTRIRRYQERYGVGTVEKFLDACLSVEDLIDPGSVFRKPYRRPDTTENAEAGRKRDRQEDPGRMPAKQYMDRYVNPPEYLEEQRRQAEKSREESRGFPPSPERDVLGFLLMYAPLENWERDVLGIVRDEAYYFLPQRQTKVMNEGWASYWHTTILTEKCLDDSELIDYADRHSGTVATAPGRLNPYKLGLELFRDIEHRWNTGRFGPEWDACDDMAERANWRRDTGQGREKIFEVRRLFSDATFLDEFLTPEFCRDQKLFVYEERPGGKAFISNREYEQIKQILLMQFTNGGRPVVDVQDANLANRAELLLTHRHTGVDLRLDWAKDVLENMTRIWKRPVRLDTVMGGKTVRLGHDGSATSEEILSEQPAEPSQV